MNWPLLKNSVLVSTLATLLAMGFGFVSALWLTGLPARWRNTFVGLSVVALALPPFVVTNCWLHFLGHAGVWRNWLPVDIFSLGGAVWILGLLLWPITLLTVCSAWRRLEPAQLESDLAVSGWALIRLLLLPLARTSLVQAGLLTFVLALNNFAVPTILQLQVFPAEMWIRFNTAFDTAGTLRLSVPLVVGPLLLLLWLARRPIAWPHLEAPVSPGLFRQQLGGACFWLCGLGGALLAFLSVALPLLQLVLVKRTWTELPEALAAGQSAVWNSFWFAGTSATVVLALSLASAWVFHSGRRPESAVRRVVPCAPASAVGRVVLNAPAPGSGTPDSITSPNRRSARGGPRALPCIKPALWALLGWLLWLPFLLPGVLLGIALITLFNRAWSALFYQSAGIVILAFVIRYLGLGWNTVAQASRATDPDLLDVARLEGASRWQTLRHVHWPQIAPQAAAAWYVVFLLCLWDVESLILVVPPGGDTLSLRIFNLLHYGHNAQVNALCLTLLVIALAPLILWKLLSSLSAYSRLFRISDLGSRIWFIVRLLMPLLACPVVLCSCSPSGSTDPLARSRLFERVELIGSRGVGVGQLNKPRSVAIDAQDNLYVVDMTGRVQKFSSNGVFLLSWQMPQTDIGKPKGMGHDRDGNIVVVEPHYQRVNHFSTGGKLITQWGEKGTAPGKFSMPRAVAMDSLNEIFVSEYGVVERVQKFAFEKGQRIAGAPEWKASYGKAGTGPGAFNRPEGLCVDAHDRLFVADSCNHRIQVFSSDGQFLRAYGRAGKGLGELSYPYDICVDAAGRQYVCEFGNSRIQVFDAQDRPLEIIGGPGAEPGRFSNPWSVALDSEGNLYVADSQNHRVQKLIRRTKVGRAVLSAPRPAAGRANLKHGSVCLPRRAADRAPYHPTAGRAVLSAPPEKIHAKAREMAYSCASAQGPPALP